MRREEENEKERERQIRVLIVIVSKNMWRRGRKEENRWRRKKNRKRSNIVVRECKIMNEEKNKAKQR